MIKKIFILFSLLLAFKTGAFARQEADGKNFVLIDPADAPSDIVRKAVSVVPSARQMRWQSRELSAFFHFGINTFTNKEWGDGSEDPALFNPTRFNALQWVQVVKDAGFKQVILTAKHHDGFCLWPSKFTEHSVKNSPWKNGKGDVVREVAEACKKLGMGFGIYLSPWDRNAAFYGEGERYNQYFKNQLTELLTGYGPVDEVWFDGANGEGPNGKKQVYDFDGYYTLIRKLQPQAVIAVMGPDVRWVGTETGYGRDTEWSIIPADTNMLKNIGENSQKDLAFAPAGDKMDEDLGSRKLLNNAKALVWYPAETDVSIRPGWFYHPEEDSKVKPPEKLLDIYFNSAGKNSVLLLNIPPDKSGLISKPDSIALMCFARLKNKIFSNNLLKDIRAEKTARDTTLVLDYHLSAPADINLLQLSEDLHFGQRVEQFVLEYEQDSKWIKAAEGTTIGAKRILQFASIKASRIRIILKGRAKPVLADIGLFKM